MLDKTAYTTTPATAQTRVITGQWLGKAGLSKRQLAELAALWLAGEIEVKPTAAMAAVLFKVSKPYITQATAALREAKAAKKNGGNDHNGNGNNSDYVVIHDKLPFVPDINDVWSHLTDEERAGFASAHLDSVWAALEAVT